MVLGKTVRGQSPLPLQRLRREEGGAAGEEAQRQRQEVGGAVGKAAERAGLHAVAANVVQEQRKDRPFGSSASAASASGKQSRGLHKTPENRDGLWRSGSAPAAVIPRDDNGAGVTA